MRTYRFVVADLPFDCILPEEIGLQQVLPSFLPFVQEEPVGTPGFVLETVEKIAPLEGEERLQEFRNDMGHVRLYESGKGFRVELNYGNPEEENQVLWMNKEASAAQAYVNWQSPNVRVALTSMFRIVFSQRILACQGFSIHASTVVKDGNGYLFLGKSGTGKSTHSRMWQTVWPEVELLNDDNPIVRMVENRVWVYGSPWSGKTPCYRQQRAPLKGMVRLKQAPMNRWTRMEGVKAWATVYPSCAVIQEETGLYEKLRATLNEVVAQVKVGQLECLPEPEAARMSEENLK